MPIEKDIGGGGPKKVAEADPMTHMELELMQNLEGGFKEAIKNGFKDNFFVYFTARHSKEENKGTKLSVNSDKQTNGFLDPFLCIKTDTDSTLR